MMIIKQCYLYKTLNNILQQTIKLLSQPLRIKVKVKIPENKQ